MNVIKPKKKTKKKATAFKKRINKDQSDKYIKFTNDIECNLYLMLQYSQVHNRTIEK